MNLYSLYTVDSLLQNFQNNLGIDGILQFLMYLLSSYWSKNFQSPTSTELALSRVRLGSKSNTIGTFKCIEGTANNTFELIVS